MKSFISLVAIAMIGLTNAFIVYQHMPTQTFSSLDDSVLSQMLTVANQHGLSEFAAYVDQNPLGSVGAFAASLGFADFAETLQKFNLENSRDYTFDEAAWRQVMLLASMKIIKKHNSENHSWQMGLTSFADWTTSEYDAIMLKGTPDAYFSNETAPVLDVLDLPQNFDWRERVQFPPAEHQGNCPSCWSFSSGTPIEVQTAYKTKQPVKPVSKQEMVDCLVGGCTRGYWPHDVYQNFISQRGGKFVSSASYPYNIAKHSCHTTGDVVGKISSFRRLNSNANEAEMMNLLYTVGPLSVTLNAGSFGLYKSGTIFEVNCPAGTSHAVVLVGWGHDAATNKDYWIIRNSWGTAWGENGYMRMIRGRNECGINNFVVYPTVA